MMSFKDINYQIGKRITEFKQMSYLQTLSMSLRIKAAQAVFVTWHIGCSKQVQKHKLRNEKKKKFYASF